MKWANDGLALGTVHCQYCENNIDHDLLLLLLRKHGVLP
jgi:hypothetical protein